MTTKITRRMSAEVSDELPPKPLVRRWWFIPAVAVAVLMGMFVLGILVLVLQMRLTHAAAVKTVKEEVARIQARGEPITTEDFYAFHKVPPGTRDTTQQWLDVLASIDETQFNTSGMSLPFVGEGDAALLKPATTGSTFAAAEQFLKDHAHTAELVHAAAAVEGQCRFPIEFEKGIGALLPHAQKMRSVQRLLALEVRVRFYGGDTAGALESISHMLAAAQTLEHQPTIIEHLVRIACLTMAFKEIEFLLNETQLTEEQLARVQLRLHGLDIQSGLTNGMLGERAMGYRTFEQVQTLADVQAIAGDGSSAGWESKVGVSVGRPVDCQKYLELLGETVAASREPFPAARERVGQVEDKVRALVGTSNPLEKLKYVVTSLLTPATSKCFDAIARALARRDTLIAAIAAERYRLRTGEFPAKLDDLVPDFLSGVPADAFNGQPLRMIASPSEAIIYSVGLNGQDDQGLETESRGEPDIVVRVKATKGTP